MSKLRTRITPFVLIGGAGALAAAITAGCSGAGASAEGNETGPSSIGAASQAYVANTSDVAAGRYLVRISGCNDCHTPGYSQNPSGVPVARWLTGNPVGFRGPWGTSYASNLRLYVAPMSEDDWVRIMRSRNDKPPMPWDALHSMSDHDLRALYRFIHSLGPAGDRTPDDVPPGQEPKTPYVIMAPPTMPHHETR